MMANDRLIIKCRACSKEHVMCKYYPSNRGIWDRQSLCDFIDEHMEKCVPVLIDLDGNRVFDLLTENKYSEEGKEKVEIMKAISNAIIGRH